MFCHTLREPWRNRVYKKGVKRNFVNETWSEDRIQPALRKYKTKTGHGKQVNLDEIIFMNLKLSDTDTYN